VSPSPRLFCLDTVMVDVVVRIDEVPRSGGDVLATEHLTTTGGGYNAMSAWSRQGVRAVYAGRLGRGPFNDIARDALASDEIAAPLESDTSQDVGFCVAMIDATGERTFITSSGSEASLRAEDLASLDVHGADYVLVSGYNVMYRGQAEVVLRWLATLSDDVVIAFDPSNRVADIPPVNLDEILSRADWVLCNEIEAATLTDTTTIEESVKALTSRTGRLGVVVRTGADGCRLISRGEAEVIVGPFETAVLDTNGAGDTHSGVFLAELARGTDVFEAARRANAGAAVAIATLGPASCPPRDVITAILDESNSAAVT
jgi:sugar/nucleoside kinase (ribokinase family)